MRVLHVLGELNHSGAERMLECSGPQWRAAGIEPLIVGMADGPHGFAPALVQAGYGVARLPDPRSLRGLGSLGRVLRTVAPDIVHIHSERCFDAIALLARATPGVRGVVRTVHSNFRFSGFLRRRRGARMELARRLEVAWIACSEEVAETERGYGIAPAAVVENWVDVDGLARDATESAGAGVRRELGIDRTATVVALIGNCGGAKNHEFAPAVLDRLHGRVHLLHVGHRRDQPAAESVAWRTAPARHVVHHLGERRDVPMLLAASDLLLLPSLYEGLSLIAIEALCAGVPVIATDTIGMQWLRAEPPATLVPLDPAAWAAAVARTRVRDGLAEGERWARDARSRFGPDRGVDQYVDVYRDALRRAPVRSRLRPAAASDN